MKVFMLGWEFPPIISGGLGVACYGLAKALNGLGVDILFVLPKPLNGSHHHHHSRALPAASSDDLLAALNHAAEHIPPESAPAPLEHDAASPQPLSAARPPDDAPSAAKTPVYAPELPENSPELPQILLNRITFIPLNAFLQPYLTPQQYQMNVQPLSTPAWARRATASAPDQPAPQPPNHPAIQPQPPVLPPFNSAPPSHYLAQNGPAPHLHGPANSQYAGDLFAETERYARLALSVAQGGGESFDVVHAHDWMTFEAAAAVAAAAGKPLILQIHSTELDRAGASANTRIMEVERCGMLTADRIIAVSYKTKTQLIEKYGIDPRKIEVVYNAATAPEPPEKSPATASKKSKKPARKHKTVLFLGRLTQQKGPDLFLHAAQKVLSVEPDVKFVIAGKGDMLDELKDLADRLQIRHRVIFTGFLKNAQTEKAFQAANVYVMPSLSEPFGISSLDALAHDVPVIISKQSGVAEVLRHVLKVDFWDTEDLANKILAILRHPPLAQTLREHGQHEVRQLSWQDSAARIIELYESLTARTRANRIAAPAATISPISL